MDAATLRSLVSQGEGEQLEFKRGTVDFSDLAEAVTVDVEEAHVSEGRVLCIRVPQTPWVVATSRGRYLRRSGTDCLPVPPSTLLELMVARGQMDISRLVWHSAIRQL